MLKSKRCSQNEEDILKLEIRLVVAKREGEIQTDGLAV